MSNNNTHNKSLPLPPADPRPNFPQNEAKRRLAEILAGHGKGIAVAGWPTILPWDERGRQPNDFPWGSPSFPGVPGGWGNPPAPQRGWDQESEAAERIERAFRSKDDIERSQKAKLLKLAAEAAGFAKEAEEAESALGARHALRKALAAGHGQGILRCWAVVCERSMETYVLGKGVSETLMAAALGADPGFGIEWLAREGFFPGAKIASLALLAMAESSTLARGAHAPIPGAPQIVRLMRAGSLQTKLLEALERSEKGLAQEARANGEAFEIGEEAGSPRLAGLAPRL